MLAPVAALIFMIVLSGLAYTGLARQNRALENIVQERTARIKQAADLAASANRSHARMYQMLSWVNASFSSARINALILDMKKRQADIERAYVELEVATEPGGAERKLIEQSHAAHTLYARAIADVIELALVDPSMAVNAMSKAERAFDMVALRMEQLSKLEQELNQHAYLDAQAEFRTLAILLPLLAGVSVSLALLLTVAVRRAMLADIGAIAGAAASLARGDVSVRLAAGGNDEIAAAARSLDNGFQLLSQTMAGVRVSAHSIDAAARDMACGQAHLALRSQTQTGVILDGLEAVRQARQMNGLPWPAGAQQMACWQEVNLAMLEMERLNRQNASLVELAAREARDLQAQAVDLSKAVTVFRLDDDDMPGEAQRVSLIIR